MNVNIYLCVAITFMHNIIYVCGKITQLEIKQDKLWTVNFCTVSLSRDISLIVGRVWRYQRVFRIRISKNRQHNGTKKMYCVMSVSIEIKQEEQVAKHCPDGTSTLGKVSMNIGDCTGSVYYFMILTWHFLRRVWRYQRGN